MVRENLQQNKARLSRASCVCCGGRNIIMSSRNMDMLISVACNELNILRKNFKIF